MSPTPPPLPANGPDLSVNFAGIHFKNPIIAASGTFGYGVEFEDIVVLDKLGGFVVKGLSLEPMAGNAPPGYSSGGMVTKLAAARIAMSAGCRMLIAKGKYPGSVRGPLAAIEAGARATLFLPTGEPRSARKAWIAGAVNPSGVVIVDDGAAAALRRGTSLLPAGVIAVEGTFERGDAVVIRTRSGGEAGRGLSAYSSADIGRIAGHKTSEIADILGYRGRDEIIHRDDLAVTEIR